VADIRVTVQEKRTPLTHPKKALPQNKVNERFSLIMSVTGNTDKIHYL